MTVYVLYKLNWGPPRITQRSLEDGRLLGLCCSSSTSHWTSCVLSDLADILAAIPYRALGFVWTWICLCPVHCTAYTWLLCRLRGRPLDRVWDPVWIPTIYSFWPLDGIWGSNGDPIGIQWGSNGDPVGIQQALRSSRDFYSPWYNSIGVRQVVAVVWLNQLTSASLIIVEIGSLQHLPGSNTSFVVDCRSWWLFESIAVSPRNQGTKNNFLV